MAVTIDGTGVVSVDGTSTTQGRVRLAEDTDNGTNYVELTAPASLGANRTVTFPDSDVNFATGLGVAQGGTGATTLTANNVILGNGTSAVQFVAPGTNGNVLTSNGTTWASSTPAAAGSWIYLSTVTVSGGTTADIETTFNSTYDAYVIVGSGITNDSNGGFYCRLKVGGSYITTTSYSYIVDESNGTSSTPSYAAVNVNGNSLIKIGSLSGIGATRPAQVYIYVNTPSANVMPSICWLGNTLSGTGAAQRMTGSGYLSTQGVLTGVRLYPQIGNFTGTFRLYGIKNS